jgi:glutaredoxin-related protein
MMMSEAKLEKLKDLSESFRYSKENKNFAIPGMLSANKDMALSFVSLRSPLLN